MEYVLEERIGNPELFTGRKEEFDFFLEWISDIKEKKSQSTAILARRKMGKTAVMERLFNITFHKNDGVIPFYYEIRESDIWLRDFCKDFFLTFAYQYIAFKTRKKEYLSPMRRLDFVEAAGIARKEGFPYMVDLIEGVEIEYKNEYLDSLWDLVRNAPRMVAARQGERIVQMIDEFQFMNKMVYRDKECTNRAYNIAGGYLSTAESKIAPLLVSGSWVGWLMNELIHMLPARFQFYHLPNLPQGEAVEMVYKYSRFYEIPIIEDTAYLLAKMAEGNPFYICSVIRSMIRDKDLTTLSGLKAALQFEILEGRIKGTWMEYVSASFRKVNGNNAKKIVLYLCKHRDREVTRKELAEQLSLDLDDNELEEKLNALVKGDIILQGSSNFRYRGVTDNIFDKVFRSVYEEDIRQFDVGTIKKEVNGELDKLKRKYNRLQGKYNYRNGYFAEYVILDRLKFKGVRQNELLKSLTMNLPEDFNFCAYSRAWRYDGAPEHRKRFNVDILARAVNPDDYTIIGEVKSRDIKKFSMEEVKAFETKFAEVRKAENIRRAVGFIFSRNGFTREAEAYCIEKKIAYSEDQRWLE